MKRKSKSTRPREVDNEDHAKRVKFRFLNATALVASLLKMQLQDLIDGLEADNKKNGLQPEVHKKWQEKLAETIEVAVEIQDHFEKRSDDIGSGKDPSTAKETDKTE
jgi:hypothetical protein